MKKFIFLIIVLLLLTNLFGIREFACMFININTSATDVAFGLNSGTANIWNTSPLSIWSNPAKLGYHKNFAFGYSYDQCYENAYFDSDVYHQSSYISYGWNGIGILFPAPSAKKRWGTVLSYGEKTWMDEEGNVIGTFESYDLDTKYGFGVNIVEFASNFIYKDFLGKINNFGEISWGYSYDNIYSKLAPMGSGSSPQEYESIEGESEFSSKGYLIRVSPFNKKNALGDFCTLDLVYGMNYINSNKTEFSYSNFAQSDQLPWGSHSAYSGRVSISKDIIPDFNLNPVLDDMIDNLFTFYYSKDKTQYGEETTDNPSMEGYGYEISILDFFYIRNGYYKDETGEIEGDTSGFGINLNYKNIIQFQFNKTKFPGGELQNEQEKTDYMIRIDFLKAYELFM